MRRVTVVGIFVGLLISGVVFASSEETVPDPDISRTPTTQMFTPTPRTHHVMKAKSSRLLRKKGKRTDMGKDK